MVSVAVTGAAEVVASPRQLADIELPLALPGDVAKAAVILEAEHRRDLSAGLLVLTEDPDPTVRARAALAVGRVGLPVAYPRLSEMLADGDPRVRALAAFGLGLLELDLEPATESATRTRIAERLIARLDDAESVVVRQALWTLGVQGDASATAAVAAVLADPRREPGTTEAALGAWWRLPGASPGPARRHLESAEPDVRYAAVTALRRLDDPDAMPALATVLRDPDALVRAAAVRGLHEAPISVADEHLPVLLRDDDWRVVCAAIEWTMALWRRDDDVPDEVFTAVLRASGNRDRHVQRLAFAALVAAPSRYSVPEDRLVVALRSDDDATRAAALEAIATDPGMADGLLDTVLSVYGLDVPPRESSASEIPEVLLTSPRQATAVVAALAAADEDRADAWLRVFADHGSVAARAEALRRLETADPEAALPAAEALLRGGDPVLRAVAAEVIERLFAVGAARDNLREGVFGALWTAQRELGERGALEPRLIVLSAMISVDEATSRLRTSVFLEDPDRVIRLWAFRNLRPERGSFSAGLVPDALGPLDTGLGSAEYREMASRLLDLQRDPPHIGVQTPRGEFVVQLEPAWAPIATLAYLDWVTTGFFDGMAFHRVVPNFVVQAGDPTGVGYGGALGGLRSEETPVPFTSGTVGLALAGRDTGGSQAFVVHSPQPHFTGLYPALGRVVAGGRFVDRVQPGDALRLTLR